jgi:hypothetical protein
MVDSRWSIVLWFMERNARFAAATMNRELQTVFAFDHRPLTIDH